jgi:hypothetical protein
VTRPRSSLLTIVLVGVMLSALALTGIRALLGDDRAAGADIPVLGTGPASSSQEATGFRLWATDAAGAPLRWDPCRPIDVLLSTPELPEGGTELLEEALERLNAASGLRLRLVGLTSEVPSGTRPLVERDGSSWRWAPVLVAWVPGDDAELPLTFDERGVALPVAVRGARSHTFVTGQILLNARRTDLRMDFADRADSWGATLLHELGHLVGLDHVSDRDQLMSVAPGSGPVEFAAGDLAGLATVGAAAGCLEMPDPEEGRGLSPASTWAR